MNRALERLEEGTAVVIPVYVNHCDWQNTEVAKLQLVPSTPVADHPNQDLAWLQVAKAITAAAEAQSSRIVAEVSTSAERFDADRYAALITAEIAGVERTIVVPAEALIDVFGSDGSEAELLATARSHRRDIERSVGSLRPGTGSLPNEIVLTKADLLPDLGGIWNTDYFFEEGRGSVVAHSDHVTIMQEGRSIRGRNDGGQQSYEVTGSIHGNSVSGEWQSLVDPDYRGSFQLVVSADRKSMNGRWLGLSKQVGVRSGEWRWMKREK